MNVPAGENGAFWHAKTSAELVLDPEATHAMGVAFDGARWVLGLASKSSDGADRRAQMIVKLAIAGERDPWRLRAGVLRYLGYCQ